MSEVAMRLKMRGFYWNPEIHIQTTNHSGLNEIYNLT